MSNRSLTVLAIIAAVVVVFTALTFRNNQLALQNNSMGDHYSAYSNEITTKITPKETKEEIDYSQFPFNDHAYALNIVLPKEGQPVKRFTLTAQEVELEIKSGVTIPVWTYNGTVPGEEIRVTQGDFVQVELKNDLKVPVTIHWHGYPLNSAMDGVPGLNQDAVKPGETFLYAFSADVAGTYWYHSHQESSEQVDKGLYGALIVEPKDKGNITRDYTLMLDEWMEKPMKDMGGMNMSGSSSGMAGMNMGDTNKSNNEPQDPVMEEEDMMAYAYDIYTVNGKSGELIEPLEVKKGDTVRLRFINAGYRSHGIHIPGQDIKVVSTDGQDINDPGIIRDQIIMIAPGERYDVEFTVTSDESFIIDAHDDNAYNDQLQIPVNVIDGSGRIREEELSAEYPLFDLYSYGVSAEGQFTLEQLYDVDYRVSLGTDTTKGLKYTINGKVYGKVPSLKVKTGDFVKLTYTNNSKVDHPMHLHGHFFQVLSKDGKPLTGAPIIKDTLMVKPGEKIVVAFKADNAGNWVQHCHELHHAAGGMMQEIEYTDYQASYIPDPKNTFNKPE